MRFHAFNNITSKLKISKYYLMLRYSNNHKICNYTVYVSKNTYTLHICLFFIDVVYYKLKKGGGETLWLKRRNYVYYLLY